MDPRINNVAHEDNKLTFTLSNIDLCFVNAFRRTLLSDIPVVVFRTFPYEDNMAIIDVNTSRLNNEIIKHRLSCIPIYINDLQFPVNDYQIEIDVKNDTDGIIFVTTKEIKVKNKTNETLVINFYLGDQKDEENKVAFVLNPNEIKIGNCSYNPVELILFKADNLDKKSKFVNNFNLTSIEIIEVY